MKRFALVLVALAGSLAVKAQNQPLGWGAKIIAENSKITFSMPVTALIADSTFKPSKGVMYANIPVDKLLKTSAIVNPDHMPITKPTNTDKCMPIVKTDRTGYNMPIAGQSKPQGPPRIYLHYKTKSGADSVVRR